MTSAKNLERADSIRTSQTVWQLPQVKYFDFWHVKQISINLYLQK